MIILTHHAVAQYVSRVDRSLSEPEAREELERLVRYADRLKERSLNGDTLWALPNGVLIITKPGTDGPVAVTVLKKSAHQNPGAPTPDELELLLDNCPDALTESSTSGQLQCHVVLRYKLSKDNVDVVIDKTERALRSALRNIVRNGIAGATLEEALFEFTAAPDKEPQ
jgi:hypothetical protein